MCNMFTDAGNVRSVIWREVMLKILAIFRRRKSSIWDVKPAFVAICSKFVNGGYKTYTMPSVVEETISWSEAATYFHIKHLQIPIILYCLHKELLQTKMPTNTARWHFNLSGYAYFPSHTTRVAWCTFQKSCWFLRRFSANDSH